MNLLSRLLALGLFVVLMLLGAVIALPAKPSTNDATSPRSTQATRRLALPLAMTALALSAGLLASLNLRPRRADDPDPSAKLPLARAEMEALSQLAEQNSQQHAALSRERTDRQFAEADAHLKQQLLNHSLEEKIRLGRDLHDSIIQSLYAAGLTLEAAQALLTRDPLEADRRLEQCRQNLNTTIRGIRAYIAGLTPEHLRQAGFAQALRDAFAELGEAREAQLNTRIDDEAAALLSAEQTTEALQIAREAMSNSLRHGRARNVTIRLHSVENEVCLLVQDNGLGFDPGRLTHSGHGLNNMRARAARAHGTVRIESLPERGTRVVLTMARDAQPARSAS